MSVATLLDSRFLPGSLRSSRLLAQALQAVGTFLFSLVELHSAASANGPPSAPEVWREIFC